MTPSEETLMAYVDGELDERARVEVEAAMLANPDIAARVARQQALRKRVHLAFETVLDESLPDRLVAAARGMSAPARENNVIPLRRRSSSPRRWSWPEWGSIAASLAAGAVFSAIFLRYSPDEPITSHNGRLFANGVLAQALSDQLAGKQAGASGNSAAAVQMGISFRDKKGDYCRTFALRDASALAGLACRSGDGWHVDVLARGASVADAAAQYRPAASSMPKPILQSVEDRIAGEPLDARGEAAAKARDWAR